MALNFHAFSSLNEATTTVPFGSSNTGRLIYIVPEDKFYYWIQPSGWKVLSTGSSSSTTTTLSALTDVNLTSPVDKSFLRYNSSTSKWIDDVLINSDITAALGFTPYSDANPYGFISTISGIAAGGELSGTYPNPTLLNSAVIAKILTGLSITGTTISATDTILQAFGKIQNQINALQGAMEYQTTWNALTNSPTLTSSTGTKGYVYRVNVAGTTSLDGIADWNVGDFAVFNGATWDKWDGLDAEIISVFGRTGAVVATSGDYNTSQVTENTNLYFTNARAIASILTGYVSGAGTISSSDSILSAIEKLNGNIAALVTGVSSVSGTTNRITSTGGTTPVIDISASYVGQTSITTLGTITTGVWNGTAIANAYLASSTISGVALGGSLFALTIGTGLSGTSYNGSTGITIAIDSTVATLTGAQALSNKTGLISQWTNDSGYLTTISGVAAGGELSGTYPNPTLVNSAVIGKVLTGYTSGAGTVSASDSILQAVQKLDGNDSQTKSRSLLFSYYSL